MDTEWNLWARALLFKDLEDYDLCWELTRARSTWLAKPEEIEVTDHKATLVFANACLANKKAMAEAFKGAQYFLAPNTEVQWIDAALFSLMFYKRYVVDGTEMRSAFEYARKRTQTSKDYPDYWE